MGEDHPVGNCVITLGNQGKGGRRKVGARVKIGMGILDYSYITPRRRMPGCLDDLAAAR